MNSDQNRARALDSLTAFAGVLPLLLGLALSLLVGVVLLRAMPLASDALAYHRQASALLAGEMSGQPFYYPPGASLYLAAFQVVLGEGVWVSRLAVALAHGLVTVFAVLLCREVVWTDRLRLHRTDLVEHDAPSGPDCRPVPARGGLPLLTGILMASYPPALLLSGQPYPQHVAHVCIVGTCLFWLKALRTHNLIAFLLSGSFLGFAALTRPASLSLGLAFACTGLWTAWRVLPAGTEKRWSELARLAAGAVLTLVTVVLTLVPVLAHNWALGEGLTLSTNNERNLLLGNCRFTPLYKTSHLAQRTFAELPPEFEAYMADLEGRDQPRTAMREEALAYIAAKPGEFILRSFNRARAFWGFDYLASRRIQQWFSKGKLSLLPLLALEAGSYILFILLAIKGLFALRRHPDTPPASSASRRAGRHPDTQTPNPTVTIILFIVSYQLPYCLAFSGGTYHFPVVALLVPFAALGLVTALREARNRDWQFLLGLRPRWVLAVWLTFLAIQAEYAYFTWKYL